MKILQLAPLFAPLTPNIEYGSVERVIMNLDREFVDLSHQSYLVAKEGSHISGDLISSGSDTDYELQSEIAIDFVLKNDVDVIHLHRSDFLLSEAFKKRGHLIQCPILSTFHGPASTKVPLYEKFKGIPNLYFNALSYSQAYGMSKIFDLSSVIYNGIDPYIYKYQEEKSDYFLMLGRITSDKGQDIAVKAIKELGCKLIIAGVILNPEDQKYFDEEVSPYIDNKKIKFIGPLNDIQKLPYLQNAKAVIMPIKWDDPCPLVAFESMACGTPLVAYDKGSLPELIRNGETGYLAKDYPSFVQSLKKADNIKPIHCRQRYENLFTSKQMAEKYFALYQLLLLK